METVWQQYLADRLLHLVPARMVNPLSYAHERGIVHRDDQSAAATNPCSV